MAKLIELTQEKFTLVDDADFEYLSQWEWCYSAGYAVRTEHSRDGDKQIRMHRLIMNAPAGMQVDHINGNPLDNRRANLRICTRAENLRNRRVFRNNTSGYKGVYPYKYGFRVLIRIEGKLHHKGLFYTKEEAARAYDKEARKYYGPFASLNFPEAQS